MDSPIISLIDTASAYAWLGYVAVCGLTINLKRILVDVLSRIA